MMTRSERRGMLWLAIILAVLGTAQRGDSQTASSGSQSNAPMRVTTRLVLVDVVVTDKQGNPITDLQRNDFELYEDGNSRPFATFSLEQPLQRAREGAPHPPQLPPNVYTNKPEYQLPPGPLSMLLVDGLNTPLEDQAYARDELLKYVETQLQPGEGTAILLLGNTLRLVQDFTTDPRLLIAAMKKLHGEKSALLNADSEIPPSSLAQAVGGSDALTFQILREFDQQVERGQLDVRVQLTLAALRAIARKASGYPGRKVLIWVSGSFPLTLHPEQFYSGNFSRFPGLSDSRYYANDVERTASMLADAQVAIYPVDARGLFTLPMRNAPPTQVSTGRGIDGRGSVAALAISQQVDELASSQDTMRVLADDSGGHAYYNRNDIAHAVALGAGEGATYYEIGFYPEGGIWDGKFHKLAVKVARPGVELRCRKGYFANDPLRWREANPKPEQELSRAMGDPLPSTQVTFMARVKPLAANQQSHIDIMFAVFAKSVTFEDEPGPKHHANLDFHAYVLSPEGKRVGGDDRTLEAHLPDETYARVEKEGIPFHMDIPVAAGNYQVHLGVRDNRTGAIGTLVVPVVFAPAGAAKP